MVSSVSSPSFLDYRALLTRYLRPQVRRVIGMAVLLLAGIALQLANPQVIRYFLDTAQSGAAQSGAPLPGAPLPGGNLRGLYLAAALYIVFAILQQALSLAANYASQNVGWSATNRLRADLTLHCLRLDLPFHKQRTPGELIERIDGDVTALANFFSQFTVRVLGDGLLVLGILLMLFRENAWVGLGMIAYTILTLVLLGQIQRLAVPRWAADRQASAEMYGYLEERISGAEEIRAAGAELYAMRRLYALMRAFTEKVRSAWVINSLTFNLTNLVYVLGYAAGLALGVWLYTRGQASLGAAYLIVYYVGMLSDPLQSIREQAQDLQQAAASIQRVKELFAFQPQVGDPMENVEHLPSGALHVALREVTFRYADNGQNGKPSDPDPVREDDVLPHDGRPQDVRPPELANGELRPHPATEAMNQNVLHNVSFEIQPGRVLGILGRTGSGKSTLTRLLFRLYDPTGGQVCLGGIDIRRTALNDLRGRVGMVTQDVQLFQASVRENLAFFNSRITDRQMEDVLRALRLWEWVQGLPQGLDTPLSAGGQGLSAGEAQLLAFTRVFLKDPGLVILDEASSRLDPATEALMERAVDSLFSGRTGVVIAHRLKTVQRADDILIFDEGRVVEYGPREELARDPNSRFAGLLRTGLEEVLA
jgi:ATP-binding cassette, subfamily B, bacterial